MTKRNGTADVIRAARALYVKAEQAAAEQAAITIGLALKQARATHKRGGITWTAFVRKQFKMCRSQAGDMVRIADGKITAAELRRRCTARSRKHHAKKQQGARR
jgi:hypothetical protein